MGSFIKKSLRFANKTQPHTWAMGERASADIDLGGQIFGAHDANYQPEDVAPAPSPASIDADAYTQRDRVRRRAARAQGLGSTVRTSPTGAPYTGAPAKLLGG